MKRAALKLAMPQANAIDVVHALDKAVGIPTEWVDRHPAITVSVDHNLYISASFPYQVYRYAVAEALRMREPIAGVVAPSVVAIFVSPTTIEAPDIVKVIVERAGRIVLPVASTLRPTAMTTRFGVRSAVHEGTVFYPCSAFRSGAPVRVTAIPASGRNIEFSFDDADLVMLTTPREELATALVGANKATVERRIGKPTLIDEHYWTYDFQQGGFRVFWNDEGSEATRVDPPALTIKTIRNSTIPPRASSPTPTAQPAPITASDLVGRTGVMVRALLGEPSTMSSTQYVYEVEGGDSVSVFLTANSVVAVSNPDLLLSGIKKATTR